MEVFKCYFNLKLEGHSPLFPFSFSNPLPPLSSHTHPLPWVIALRQTVFMYLWCFISPQNSVFLVKPYAHCSIYVEEWTHNTVVSIQLGKRKTTFDSEWKTVIVQCTRPISINKLIFKPLLEQTSNKNDLVSSISHLKM